MARPRRPDQTILDPELLERGEIGELTAWWDEYFRPSEPGALEIILGELVDGLDEPYRSCVQMVAMHGMTNEEAAAHLEAELGRRVHRKTVWRWVRRGLDEVQAAVTGTSWFSVLLSDRVPGSVPRAGADNVSTYQEEGT